MNARRVEEASLNAWPAIQQVLFDGWVLRFSRGYTKRANSVNAMYASSLDLDEKITFCEGVYRERCLPCIFRLTPFSTPDGLDMALQRRGYGRIDPTMVLYLDLTSLCQEPETSVRVRHEDLDGWMEKFCRLMGTDVTKHQAHKEILRAIPSARLLAALMEAEQAVACGVGVLENDYLGLFDLVTHPDLRNRGYGGQLVSSLLRWGSVRGAKYAYLQVMTNNVPALGLYAKYGFREAYGYWYRVPPQGYGQGP